MANVSSQTPTSGESTVTGGHLVARALRAEGVEAIFTLCGGHIIDIYDGCADAGIRIIDVRHEQAAAHAADAWTRLTGFPGCAVVTAGPGTTDTVTAVANAWRAQTPMLVIGGQGALGQAYMGSLQELDHVSLMKPITKFAGTVYRTERIPDVLGMAFRQAYNGRPGPVFVEIPRDVLDAAVPESAVHDPGRYRSPSLGPYGDQKLIDQAAQLLARAERPVLLAGSQLWHCRGAQRLDFFVSSKQVPVYLNGAARGSLPAEHPLLFNRSRRDALANADVIVVLGTPFDFRLAYGRRLGVGARLIQIDLDYGELGHNRGVDVGITGNVTAVLAQLGAAIEERPPDRKPWLDHLRSLERAALEKDFPFLHSDAVPIHPLRLAKEINDFLTEDSIFIGDGGEVVTIAASVIHPRRPGHWLDPGPLGTLGVGMPFAIAAKVARPDQEALVLFGDGAFGFNGFEYDTAMRFGLPVLGVVGNNAAWNQIRYGQVSKYGTQRGSAANLLAPTRYDRVVEVLGGYGEHVTDPKDIRPALERARASGRPSCVNVMIDPDIYGSGTMNQTMYQ